MNLEELQKSGRIAYSVIGGSYSYGTQVPTSDRDLRGLFCLTKDEYLDIGNEAPNQIGDEKNDILYYSLLRFLDLLRTANPNICELLWTPPDCILYQAPYLQPLFDNRRAFITQKTYFTHGAYSVAQIKKATGTNKRVHNPKPEARPLREDFCYFIDVKRVGNLLAEEQSLRNDIRASNVCIDGSEYGMRALQDGLRRLDADKLSQFPCRPVPISLSGIDLSKCHASALERVPYTYRLYNYGDKAKGVFRGDDNLVCESIPVEDEWDNFVGLLVYNKADYEREIVEWKQYHEWMRERNAARWTDQENGEYSWDGKNMQHCIRLLLSAKNILEYGEPIVRFTGEKLQILRDIRDRKPTYEEILKYADKVKADMDVLFEKCKLPKQPDPVLVNKIFMDITSSFENLKL